MKRKIYEPVREFERQTSYCPLYLAWHILDEARTYFRTPIPEAFADKLAHRAEAAFAHDPSWARKASNFAEASMDRSPRAGARQQFEYRRQREFILMFMRHWLAGVLAREEPALFRQLPESFKIGRPLPSSVLRTPSSIRWTKGLPAGRDSRRAGSALVRRAQAGSRLRGDEAASAAQARGSPPRRDRRSPHHRATRFVHGCELLAV
jgi:hypothetical protein